MPQLNITPESADISGWDESGGTGIGILSDGATNTYYYVEEGDLIPAMNNMVFSTHNDYGSEVAIINSITLNIQGKVTSGTPSLITSVTCTHRGEEGTYIQPATVNFLSGAINISTSFTNLSLPNADVSIDDGHIDTITLNITASDGTLLISEIYIEVDYTPLTEGHISLNKGFVELTQGFISLG